MCLMTEPPFSWLSVGGVPSIQHADDGRLPALEGFPIRKIDAHEQVEFVAGDGQPVGHVVRLLRAQEDIQCAIPVEDEGGAVIDAVAVNGRLINIINRYILYIFAAKTR